ncbi:Domain of uncharacterised function (DUF1788) [Chryseobacterium taklimakanense]|uniref:Domain of uncharacterized function (DUF1788) n=1 Tax=Chryseobacterium taklimakanense TaxID=536441 RepID=A0A239X5B5_9FLAO|nr:DUF1788 domain-containing protein [Chryseobacterium taklimakanense]SNV41600.1 Domain of uncharacterised function (DUF1788) [Chryseobacterium taklimakanense]
MEDITKKFTHLYKVISSPNFLNKESLGGEIPFFISAYDAKNENEVAESIKLLKNKLDTAGVSVLEINLYDVVCDILNLKGGVERMFPIEKSRSKDKFLNALQSTLNIHQILTPKIKEMIEKNPSKVYFLTGIGLVFPYIRSHNILNNLQNIAKDSPTVIFFPGEYNGNSLNLFGMMKDDNYYRAFNIDIIDPKP